MAWGTKQTSTALTLTSSYQIVQQSAADLEIELNPGEGVLLLFDVDFQTTPTENADIVIEKAPDLADWETSGEAERHIIEAANRETDDPAKRAVWVTDTKSLRVQARTRDTDDTAGGDDSSTTLTVHYIKNGINV